MKKNFFNVSFVTIYIVTLLLMLIEGIIAGVGLTSKSSKDVADATLIVTSLSLAFPTGISGLATFPIIGAVASCLVFSEKKPLANLGYLFGGLLGVYGLVDLIIALASSEPFLVYNIGLILFLLLSVIYIIYILTCFFVGRVKPPRNETNEEKEPPIDQIKKYKAMKDAEIINDKEYDDLKVKAVYAANKAGVVLDDLTSWKELEKEGLITDKEFAYIKSALKK